MHFKICCSLVILLQEPKLLKQQERLVAYFILYDLYEAEQRSSSPFMSMLVDAAADERVEKLERAFVLSMLRASGGNSKEVCTIFNHYQIASRVVLVNLKEM
ncbi:hypothetical protein O6H91_03G004400 [Diphasiastrum complanatum]|uniref:Uncharacterized protein n=1 Tax=Diphasiastrum complanatum TaxID=34168 RepID=A0ACC2E2Y5_DIPCM|nr:hypothetical protein O6H91_03G004400 [Diphasiastrum complanatum]